MHADVDANLRKLSDAKNPNREYPKSALASKEQLAWLEQHANPKLADLFSYIVANSTKDLSSHGKGGLIK